MSTSRDEILSRLRAGRERVNVGHPQPRPTAINEAGIFADLPPQSALRDRFRQKLGELSGELIEARTTLEAAGKLGDLLSELKERRGGLRVAAQELAQLAEMRAVSAAFAQLLGPVEPLPDVAAELATYDVGITGADALVARTGSVFVRSSSSGGRQLSVLPPVHVVIAESASLVASIGDVLSLLEADRDASFATLISGPSRTADIEKILVLGAHGPRRLVVVLLG